MSSAIEQETQSGATETPQPTALVVQDQRSLSAFGSRDGFDAAVPIAKALAASTVVPEAYRNNTANCLVALELASRTGASVLMVMQNLHIIKGKPSWSAAFLVASVNTSSRFSPLRYETEGEPGKNGWRCRAFARELATGDVLYGTWITWEMANGEGWVSRNDSKWKTMPEQMIRYRAAAFWTRTFAPEISLGMHTADEIEDANLRATGPSAGARDLNAAIRVAPEASHATTTPDVVVESDADLRREELELLRQEEGR